MTVLRPPASGSFVQAAAAAQAGVSVISPNIGRIGDFYQRNPGAIRNPRVGALPQHAPHPIPAPCSERPAACCTFFCSERTAACCSTFAGSALLHAAQGIPAPY